MYWLHILKLPSELKSWATLWQVFGFQQSAVNEAEERKEDSAKA